MSPAASSGSGPFVGLSAAQMPPVAWFVVFGLARGGFRRDGWTLEDVDYALLVSDRTGLASGPDAHRGYPETHWSPYQKLVGWPGGPR